MNLNLARHYALQITNWIKPFCDRIEIAGSIRRGRPVCNDVDLVVIPKMVTQRDLFGKTTGQRMPLHDFLSGYVDGTRKSKTPGAMAQWLQGRELKPSAKQFLIQLPKVQLDLWLADEANFGARWLTRTGPMQHNIWIAQRASAMGLHFAPYEGLRRGDTFVAGSEDRIYELMGLPFIAPEDRDEAPARYGLGH